VDDSGHIIWSTFHIGDGYLHRIDKREPDAKVYGVTRAMPPSPKEMLQDIESTRKKRPHATGTSFPSCPNGGLPQTASDNEKVVSVHERKRFRVRDRIVHEHDQNEKSNKKMKVKPDSKLDRSCVIS
jgi:hypothetical protein